MRLTLDSPITPAGSLPDLMPLGHLRPPRLQAPTFVFYGTPPSSSALLYHTIAASLHRAPEKTTQVNTAVSLHDPSWVRLGSLMMRLTCFRAVQLSTPILQKTDTLGRSRKWRWQRLV